MATKTQSTPDSMRLFLDDLDRHPLPDHAAQVELAKLVAAGDEEARQKMVAANLRLVVHWARRYQDRGVDFGDLVQEGTFGLMRAVDKFDWERGFKFSTYATWWIRQALQRAVQQHASTIRVPMEVGERSAWLDRTRWELASEMKREPTLAELAELAGIREPELQSLGTVARVVASLDQPAGSDSSTPLGDLVGNEEPDLEDIVERRLVLEQVRRAVEDLDEFERQVVELRFGLNGDEPASLQATASKLGVGIRRVRQAEARAMRSLAEDAAMEAAHRAA